MRVLWIRYVSSSHSPFWPYQAFQLIQSCLTPKEPTHWRTVKAKYLTGTWLPSARKYYCCEMYIKMALLWISLLYKFLRICLCFCEDLWEKKSYQLFKYNRLVKWYYSHLHTKTQHCNNTAFVQHKPRFSCCSAAQSSTNILLGFVDPCTLANYENLWRGRI